VSAAPIRAHARTPLTMWRVRVSRHACSRWIVPASVSKLPAPDARSARLFVLRTAHARLDMPCWRPLIRRSWPHSSAERIGAQALVPPAERRSAA
jgi:hypothetical protein